MTEAKANSETATASILPPAWPITRVKAACAAEGPSGTPLVRMASAVTEQTKMVSQNTSKMPQKPCSTGLSAPLQAWAIEALPRPASWVKIPRAMPTRMETKKPEAPPATTELGEKAPLKICAKALGMFCRKVSKITPQPTR